MKRIIEADLQTKLTGHRWEVTGLQFSPNGLDLASSSWDKEVRIWDLSTLETRCFLRNQHTFPITSVAWKPGETSSILATSSSDNTCCIWNTQSGGVLRVLEHDNWVLGCAFSPNAQHLATGCWDKTLRIWDAETGAVLNSFSGHSSGIWTCEFSPVAAHVVCSGTEDGSIKVFDTRSGNLVLSLVGGHEDSVKCCSWSADGQHLASGGVDMKIAIWDASSGSVLTRIKGHEDTVTSVKFYPVQGRMGVPFVLSTGDRTCRFWYATKKDNKQLLCLKQHGKDSEVQSMAVSKDGTLIATGARDGLIALSSVTMHVAEAEDFSASSKGHGAKLWKKYTRKVIENMSTSGTESVSSDTSQDEDSDVFYKEYNGGLDNAGMAASSAVIVGAAVHHQDHDPQKVEYKERRPSVGTLMLKKTRTQLRHIDENENTLHEDNNPPERVPLSRSPVQQHANGTNQVETPMMNSGVVVHHRGHHGDTVSPVPNRDQKFNISAPINHGSNGVVIHHQRAHTNTNSEDSTSRL